MTIPARPRVAAAVRLNDTSHGHSDAEAVRRWLDGLPGDSLDLLAALSTLGAGCTVGRLARLAAVAAPAAALAPLEVRGLIVMGEGAVRQDRQVALAARVAPELPRLVLTPTRRRALHQAAAERLDPGAAWVHRVAAAGHLDESLAAELEAAALTGAAEPGSPSPATLLEWASHLSGAPAERERRLLLAALHHMYAEDDAPAGFWQAVEDCAPSALRGCALAGRALAQGRISDAESRLRLVLFRAELAGGFTADEPSAAAIVYGVAAAISIRAARGEPAVQQATAGLAQRPDDPALARWLRRLRTAGRCYVDGPRAALDASAESGSLIERAGHEPDQLREAVAWLDRGTCRVLAGDLRYGVGDLLAVLDHPDAARLSTVVGRAHQWLAVAYHLLGSWRRSEEHAGLAIDLAHRQQSADSGVRYALAAMLAAHRGEWSLSDEYQRRAKELDAGAFSPDDRVLAVYAHAEAIAVRGDPTAALPALARLVGAREDDAQRKLRSLWLPLYAEAVVEAGSLHDADAALGHLDALADQTPYLRVTHHRLAGRLAERRRDARTARWHYEAALCPAEQRRTDRQSAWDGAGAGWDPKDLHTVPLQLALLEHAYGRLLGALGEPDEAVAWLGRARTRMAAAGAVPFARRCAADLAVSAGPTVEVSRYSVLTERERAVARLVADGLTNQEAAARLYISAKTVEYHLARIYGKLGIHSRRQLARLGSLGRL
jgi:DNA-binding CsgD family transcriptional regulator